MRCSFTMPVQLRCAPQIRGEARTVVRVPNDTPQLTSALYMLCNAAAKFKADAHSPGIIFACLDSGIGVAGVCSTSRFLPDGWMCSVAMSACTASCRDDEQVKYATILRMFIAERWWEGCNGLAINDEVRVTIAAQACVLTMHLREDREWSARCGRCWCIRSRFSRRTGAWAGRRGQRRLGQQRQGVAQRAGRAVVVERCPLGRPKHDRRAQSCVARVRGHVLDMADGISNGTPPLQTREQYRRWHEVMTGEYQRLINDAEFGHAALLDVYGTTNVAEFFAVATEAFFERGRAMRQVHPDLYSVLHAFYGHDPAEWTHA